MNLILIITGKIKRKLAKRRIRSRESYSQSLNEGQKNILKIYDYIINDHESDLFYSLISDTCYIQHKEVTIKICDGSIILTNGIYWYNVEIPIPIIAQTRQRFLRNLESRRRVLQKACDYKLKESTEKIYQDLTGR